MENLRELKISEMIEISGGVNPAYELGYAIGSTLKQLLLIKGIQNLLFI